MIRMQELLSFVYGENAAREMLPRVTALMEKYRGLLPQKNRAPLDERTALLITYGDQVRAEKETPLQTLADFLNAHARALLSGVHILPFYPYSSDDGFSVMDYYAVDEKLGTWDDVARVGEHFDLMFDAVINHASAQGAWFQNLLRDVAPYNNYFFTVTNEFVTTNVVRPRALPLLTAFQVETPKGVITKRVWTTFSADQVDLNYRNPELLLQMLDVLLFYIARGARFLRLDAIAFMWKESGTTCLHLPQTHALIQFFRGVLNEIAPDVILVTETNVPHADNISYFGDGTNEAQWVYNFALPPLTLHTLQTGDATKLAQWASALRTPSNETAFFNFLASHDGIGLNPARDILSQTEIDALVTRTLERGGLISHKNNPDGTVSPYEMNVNFLDALTERDGEGEKRETRGEGEIVETREIEMGVARLLCAHAIQLSLAGVPGIYFHSLFGSRGDRAGADASGIARRINRQKFSRAELERDLADKNSRRSKIFTRLAEMLRVRGQYAAFHPQAAQEILQGDARVFAVLRSSENERVLCLHNVTDARVRFVLPGARGWQNLFSGAEARAQDIELQPYETAWLSGVLDTNTVSV